MRVDRRDFYVMVLIAHLAAYVAIIFDIPLVRQIALGFFLSFLPGIVLVRLIRLNINKTETIVFTLGLSIALLMFLGLMISELFPYFGISKPLAVLPTMITLSISTAVLCLIDARLHRSSVNTVKFAVTPKTIVLVALLSSPILFSVLGSVFVNTLAGFGLLSIVVISAIVILSILVEWPRNFDIYPLAVASISLALLLHTSLISRFLIGFDVHSEYHFAGLTKQASSWSADIGHEYSAMLSVTILPTIYSNLLNIDLASIFKILYPLFFSLVPLGLYATYRKRIGKKAAFLSAFFFMASSTFHNVQMLSLGRQMVAELFFVLLIYLLLDRGMKFWKRRILILFFGAAMVVSHYTLSYIYLLYLALIWFLQFFHRDSSGLDFSKQILFFLTVVFSWNIYIALSAPFTSFVDVLGRMSQNFSTDLLNWGARGYHVQRTVWVGAYTSLLHRAGSIVQNITQSFILLGFAIMMARRNEVDFNKEFVSMSVGSMAIVFASILVPFFAPSLNVPRFYHTTLYFLAPLCILGAITIFRRILRSNSTKFSTKNLERLAPHISALVSLVLIIFFLFETGFVYEVSGDHPTAIPLSFKKVDPIQFHSAVTSEVEVSSARWLSTYSNRSFTIYADEVAKRQVLISYGATLSARENMLTNATVIDGQAYIYLTHLNVVKDKIIGGKGRIWNTSDLTFLLSENKIYSNGESEIYFTPVHRHP